MRAIISAIVIFMAAQSATAETVTVTVKCGNQEKTISRFCIPGEEVEYEVECNGQIEVKKTFCPSVPANWSLGVGGYTLGAGDLAASGTELQIMGHFRVARDWLWATIEARPGVAWVDEGAEFSLSELGTLNFRPLDWLSVNLGVQHRVTFDAEGATLNGVYGVLGLRFNLYQGLYLQIGGTVGYAWFSTQEDTIGILPAGVEVPVPGIKNTHDASWGFDGQFGYNFF